MFNSDRRMNTIYDKIEELGYTGHSGCSFAFTMRSIQLIAKHGEEKFRRDYLNLLDKRRGEGLYP
jgi:hypothetical protein